jgi:hypothetical protein
MGRDTPPIRPGDAPDITRHDPDMEESRRTLFRKAEVLSLEMGPMETTARPSGFQVSRFVARLNSATAITLGRWSQEGPAGCFGFF